MAITKLTSTRVLFANAAEKIAQSADFLFNDTTKTLTVSSADAGVTSTVLVSQSGDQGVARLRLESTATNPATLEFRVQNGLSPGLERATIDAGTTAFLDIIAPGFSFLGGVSGIAAQSEGPVSLVAGAALDVWLTLNYGLAAVGRVEMSIDGGSTANWSLTANGNQLVGTTSEGTNNGARLRIGNTKTVTPATSLQINSLDVMTATVTLSGTGTGTITRAAHSSVGTLTITKSSGAWTITNAAGLYVSAAPVGTGVVTITNSWAIWVDAGPSRLDGDLRVGFDSTASDFTINNAALATTATTGFIYIPGGAGPPTGTPAKAAAGFYPVYWDSTNNKLYLYDGGWLGGTTPGAWT